MAPSPSEIAAALQAEVTAHRAHEALELAEGRVRRLGDNPDGAATALGGIFARVRREHPVRAVLHVLRLRVDPEFSAWERAREQAAERKRGGARQGHRRGRAEERDERANPAGVVLCRRCRVPMKLIAFAGEKFWGCSRYPKCRQRLTYTGP
jgi:hypothetical protein